MVNFSLGIINVPVFSGVNVSSEDSDLTFDHDLNTTIETLFHEQVRTYYLNSIVIFFSSN